MEERVPLKRATAAALLLAALLSACAVAPTAAPPEATVATANLPAPTASTPPPVEAPKPAPAPPPPEPADPAAAAGTPTDPVRPEEPVDLDVKPADRDLWERIRRGFAMGDLDTDLVRAQERWYASRPDYVARMTERSSRYLFHIVEEIERRGMPTELALLPFIESAFNPQAMSSAKASGMWQFIPSTGKHYELTQNIFRDDRRDVLASTRAALDYLQKLHGMFGDWQLALAAYNWGEGSVGRAIAKNQKAGRAGDYLSLSMPAETRNYVPKLQAVKNLVARPQDFGLELAPLENHPYFLSVPIQRDIDSALVARLAGLPMAEFHALNPSLNKPVILAAGTPQVLLPYDNATAFMQALPKHRGTLASWTAWTVPKTMRPAEAAKQAGMSEATLREVNRIPPRMLIRAGSTLLVPRHAERHGDVSERVADGATMHLVADGPKTRRASVKARKGDSVASIAARYKLSAASVASWNKVSAGAKFAAGQAVVVYLPAKAASKKARTAAKSAASRNGRSAAVAKPKASRTR
ncbi:MAG TPA: transglycosylase SLT domain-containing protein [Methylibium sp.]|uniref:transglycosylase SLT domain-containing protein n=1 Tax=Methylibium sp. TaxID=2067992 RepID=UPI002DB59196|nr:transglycosylase SLT domain-containing protein [Methylibium sp.]HEU4459445.1 transglycosylase SLT domain-containing protein [Methylibium sp.]